MIKRLVLSGYYGFDNAGDDAILSAIVEMIHRSDPEIAVTVVTYPSGDLAAIRSVADVEAIDGRFTAEAFAAIANASLLVIGGGGLVQDYLPSTPQQRLTSKAGNLSFWASLALMAQTAGTPVTSWALGVGPLTTDDGLTEARLIFQAMEKISVRDDASRNLVGQLTGAEVEIHADPVYSMEPSGADPLAALAEIDDLPHEGSIKVMVAVRNWESDHDWKNGLAAALDRLVEELNADIFFVPFQAGKGLSSDALASTHVGARMRHSHRRAVVGSDLGPKDKLDLLSQADLVIGMRLHSVVYAASAAVPTVAIPYDPKVSIAMEALGQSAFSVPLNEVGADRLVEAAHAALASQRDIVRETRGQLSLSARSAADFVLAQMADKTTPSPPVAALGEAAITRAGELESTEVELSTTKAELASATFQLDNITRAYDTLAAEYNAFLEGRAIRMVRSVWTARDQIKQTPAAIKRSARKTAGKVLPGPVKKRLRTAIGPGPRPTSIQLSDAELNEARSLIETQLDGMLRAYEGAPGFVILPPGIGWDVELFQRPQQMSLAFAELGYPVLYHLQERYRDGLVGFRDLGNGILVGWLPDQLVDLLHRIPEPIYLSYVYNFEWREHLERPITVYEHIDDLEVFEHVYKRDDLDRWHQDAIQHAEVAAASAIDLLTDLKRERADAILVPNGVDYTHFALPEPPAVPADIAHLGERPLIGYYGALAEWFDYDLLDHAAAAMEDVYFLLIGPDYDGTASKATALERPNVHWLGPRPYAELPAYLSAFDVATVPFVVNDVTHAVSPLKLFEYMAGGKPVVTPPLRECSRYRAVQIGEGRDGFVAALRRAIDLAHDPAHIELLRRTARANTWDARARTVIEAVERAKLARSAGTRPSASDLEGRESPNSSLI